ncbi:MFS transporter [Deinococcus deserti]|uniref:Putative Major Facilitator Superfamily protein putative membrane protein n=1 Tax=Deinococcus deserti (strain DSM 17065 / CIP 109153 / LMG 22923 / VCD115) TaxID=546414 RepID=C1D401_DEIDV|nr:MFS transporter [Deinococcus deserti]ACO48230.2 putative Major Facilitator Superfamily protein; putative membrane protein [Deinococcus deserti VCD115]
MSLIPVPSPAPPKRLAGIGVGAFLLLGLLYPILGPALPLLSEQFGLRATGASLLLSLNSAGAVLGVILAGVLSARLTSRNRSLLAVATLAVGCVGLAFAPTFVLALLAALLLGSGFGMLDLTLNVWLSTSYGLRSAAMLNLLSATFGVGAVLAPLAVGFADGDFRLPLLGCAALAGLLLLSLFALPSAAPEVYTPTQGLQTEVRSPRLILGGFMCLFLAYVAVESGVASWEVTHLRDTLGITTGTASQLSALFWVSFTLGRLISAPLALRVAPAHLVTGSLVLAAFSLALATIPAVAPYAYTLTGLFLAPVFTTGLVWLTRVLPGGAAPTFVFAGAFLGPVLFSPVVGAMRDQFGPPAIPLTLMGIALLDLAIVIGLRRNL